MGTTLDVCQEAVKKEVNHNIKRSMHQGSPNNSRGGHSHMHNT